MKKILILIVVVFSIKASSQTPKLIDKTFMKLKNDKKSFEQFVFYGFCNCTDKFLYTNTYTENYITSFNHLEPLPRFFEKNNIAIFLDNYQNFRTENFKNIQEKYYNGYLVVTKCKEIYTINQKLKKIYINIISDKKLQNEWSDDDMKDYLDGYFIKMKTE